jgi:hypothetical protein
MRAVVDILTESYSTHLTDSSKVHYAFSYILRCIQVSVQVFTRFTVPLHGAFAVDDHEATKSPIDTYQ